MAQPDPVPATAGSDYARRLQRKSGVWWKRVLNVQAPYQWNLRRQHLGRTLDIGCGIGRNLVSLPAGSLGVDHNADSVRIARESGLEAMTVEEFTSSPRAAAGGFDSLLLAHVVEHMDEASAVALLHDYLPYLAVRGSVFMICPQERGYATDATHERFVDGAALESLCRSVGLRPAAWTSFPFPRAVGRWFTYNEFCLRATKP